MDISVTGKADGEGKVQLVLDQPNAVAVITVCGEWTVRHLPSEERVKIPPLPKDIKKLIINGANLSEVDTSGAWLLLKCVRALKCDPASLEWIGFSDTHSKLIAMVDQVKHEILPVKSTSAMYNAIVELGESTVEYRKEAYQLTVFFGQLCIALLKSLRHPSRIRVKSVIYHANQVGIEAIPIIILLAISISIVLGYQGANQLRPFGAMSFTVNLVAISMLREMGVLITAIMASGRSCSSFAAQIGVMQMNDEVAALRTLGLDPFDMLVIPRVLGILIALPALTFIADLAGLGGNYFIAHFYLGLSYEQVMNRLQPAITDMTFYIGLIKAPVFAIIIAVIGCFQGLQVRSSATELGARTTSAVVQAIFLIVIADALFSLLFTLMNI